MNEDPQHLDLRERFYAREPPSVPAAREFARQVLADWGAGRRAADILLCVSELATNALLHGCPRAGAFSWCCAATSVTRWRVELHDSGSPSAPYAGGTYTFTVTRRLPRAGADDVGLALLDQHQRPGRELDRALADRAEPYLTRRRAICSAQACSLLELSLLSAPGASVMVAAWDDRVREAPRTGAGACGRPMD